MKIIKKHFSVITIVIIALLIISTIIFSFSAIKNIKVSYMTEQMEYKKTIHMENTQNFVNSIEQNNINIDNRSYLASFLHDYVYEDIHFLTSCEGWDEERLEAAAIELFSNTHGEEIKLITAVIFEEGDGAFTYGYQQGGNEYYPISTSLHGVFPEDSAFYHANEKSILYVTNVTARTDVGDYAQALSVAYGYHFVNYYMGIEGTADDKDTEYYNIRAQGNENVKLVFEDNDDYMENYKWDLETIAANDYMYLLGSKNANRIVINFKNKYYDDIDFSTVEGPYMALMMRYRNGRNTTPHINLNMDLPDSVDGLAEYFYSFVDEVTPEDTEPKAIADFNFRTDSKPERNNLYAKDNVLLWTAPYEDEDIMYSVIEYNMDDDILNILSFTKGSGENEVDLRVASYNRTYITDLGSVTFKKYTENQIKIRIIAAFPDGSIVISEPFEYVYDESKLEENSQE